MARGHRDEVDGVRFEGAGRGAARAGRARGAGGRRPDRDRAEQPVRQHRPDPRRAPGSARRSSAGRVPAVAVSPLIGGKAVRGPAARMLARLARRNRPAASNRLLQGVDRRARDRRGRRGRRGRRADDRHAHADGRRRGPPPASPRRCSKPRRRCSEDRDRRRHRHLRPRARGAVARARRGRLHRLPRRRSGRGSGRSSSASRAARNEDVVQRRRPRRAGDEVERGARDRRRAWRTRSARRRCSAWRATCASPTPGSCRASTRARWPRTLAG